MSSKTVMSLASLPMISKFGEKNILIYNVLRNVLTLENTCGSNFSEYNASRRCGSLNEMWEKAMYFNNASDSDRS